jgi:hypothetical protein
VVDRPQWQQERELFLQAVTDHFRGRHRDLLHIDIPGGQGWETLCPFLGVEIPSAPFPWQNRCVPAMESEAVD